MKQKHIVTRNKTLGQKELKTLKLGTSPSHSGYLEAKASESEEE